MTSHFKPLSAATRDRAISQALLTKQHRAKNMELIAAIKTEDVRAAVIRSCYEPLYGPIGDALCRGQSGEVYAEQILRKEEASARRGGAR